VPEQVTVLCCYFQSAHGANPKRASPYRPERNEIMARKYSRSASKDVERVMRKRKRGSLKSGSGRKVKSRKQAIAIGLSEARRKGKKVPRKSTGRKGAGRKTKGRKSSGRKRS
jgi:hypothetical protein